MGRFRYAVPDVSTDLTREGTIERIKQFITFELHYFRSEADPFTYGRVSVEMNRERPPFHCKLNFYPGNKRLALSVCDWEHMDTEQSAIALMGAIESLLAEHAEEHASGK